MIIKRAIFLLLLLWNQSPHAYCLLIVVMMDKFRRCTRNMVVVIVNVSFPRRGVIIFGSCRLEGSLN